MAFLHFVRKKEKRFKDAASSYFIDAQLRALFTKAIEILYGSPCYFSSSLLASL